VPRLTVAPFPPPPADGSAPYLELLYGALARRDVEVKPLRSVRDAAADDDVDVVHLHWLEYLTRSGQGPARDWVRGARLMRALRGLGRSGKRVVWTVHNLRPHERRSPRLEDAVARAALRSSDWVIAHSNYAARRVAETYGGEDRLAVVPHGNFIGFYPQAERSLEQIRAGLGVPREAFLYLAFGQLRRYKRVHDAVRAFRQVADDDARMLVAGSAWDARARDELLDAAEGDERVLLELRHVPDERVAELHHAADAVVLPYPRLFSSGALLLALSFGVPAVVPAEGGADVAEPPAIETFEEGDLAGALRRVREGDGRARHRAARAAAERVDWDAIADRTLELYEGRGA
jgi:glycosyltransferase involved in cell wall biosynthesis